MPSPLPIQVTGEKESPEVSALNLKSTQVTSKVTGECYTKCLYQSGWQAQIISV